MIDVIDQTLRPTYNLIPGVLNLNAHRIVGLLLVTCSVLTAAPAAVREAAAKPQPATAVPLTPQKISLYTIAPMDHTTASVELSASFPSQTWLRSWLKRGFAPNYSGGAGAAAAAHTAGALFGGGVTCSDVFRYENGLTDQQFMDFATRDPSGKLVMVPGGYYHGAIANRAYLDYVLSWANQQIDAGADTLLMENPNGNYSPHEGFDPYSLAAFSQYLIDRFVTASGWSVTDDRWRTQLGVDLEDAQQCPDHTVQSFNYSGYLKQHGWADNPSLPANPFLPIWGDPNDVDANTFCAARNATAWKYWTTQIRLYAQQHHRQVFIATHGLNRWVDTQVVSCPWKLPLGTRGEFVVTRSNLRYWRVIRKLSEALNPGQDTPIVAFQDWNDGEMPWQKLSPPERRAWLQVYAPEAFASGIFFAYPLAGPYGLNASADGTLPIMEQQALFVRYVSPLLHGVTLQDLSVAGYTGKAEIIVEGQQSTNRLIVHLVNRLYDHLQPVDQKDRVLQLPVGARPLRVRLYTAEKAATVIPAWTFTPAAGATSQHTSGTVSVPVGSLTTWDIVQVDLPEWRPLPG